MTDPVRAGPGSTDPVAPPPPPAGGISLASVGRSAVILTTATVAVQVLGIFREVFLAAEVGLSVSLDALLIGLVLPATLSNILTSGPSTALVPAYLDARASGGLPDARRLAGTVLVWLALAGLALTLALEYFAPEVVAVVGPGLDAAARGEAVDYLRLLAPMAFVASISGTVYAVCQAEKLFASIAWATLAGPAVSLAVMLLLWDRLDLAAFAVSSIIGPIVTLALLVLATVRRSIAPRLHLLSRGIGLGSFGRHALPLTMSSAILQLNVIFDRAIASLLAPGAVSALRYGDTLVRLPIGAISPAFSAAVYPAFVGATHDPSPDALAAAAQRTLQFVLAMLVPVAVLLIAVAPVAVSVAYGRGAFTPEDLHLTAQVVAGFAPLVVLFLASQVLTSALNARRSGRVLLMAGILNVIINLVLDLTLGLSLGVIGIALSSSLTAAIVLLFKASRMSRREHAFRVSPLVRQFLLATAAALPAALVCGVLSWSGTYPSGLIPGLVTLGVFGIVGLCSYVVIASRLGMQEPRELVDLALARVWRGRRSSGSPA